MIRPLPIYNEYSIQALFLTPFEEGALRIQNFIQELRFTSIVLPARPLKERVIKLLTGIALMSPLTNIIIWIAICYIENTQPFSPFHKNLRSWVQEAHGTPEYLARQTAAQRIMNCAQNQEESLDLTYLHLTTLPDAIGNLVALKQLLLSYNGLTTLPDAIGNLVALEKLGLSDNRLTTLPDAMGNLAALEVLNLYNNRLTTLPDAIGRLVALKELSLSRNQLTTLPDAMGSLVALKELDLSNNRLTTLPDTIGGLIALTKLNLSKNLLTPLPDVVSNLRALEVLYLEENRLTTLPDAIGNLVALQALYLRINQITTIPDTVVNLRALTTLDLEANRLTTLPPMLAQQLSRGCTIFAERNRLSPVAIRAFQDVIEETRRSNPLLGPIFEFSIHDIKTPDRFTSLEENITFWLKKFQIIFPKDSNETLWATRNPNRYPSEENTAEFLSFYQPLRDLDETQKKDLNEFLRRLKDTEDYKSPRTQANIVLRVDRMLEGACKNPEFLEQMNAIIDIALATCSDRVAEAFDQIEIAWKILCNAQNLSEPELADFVIGLDRLDRLTKITHQKIREKRLGDAIETILYYRIRLATVLKLPISTEGMLYPNMSGITTTDLEEAKEKIMAETGSQEQQIEILCLSDLWKSRMRKKNVAAFEQLSEAIGELMSSDISEDEKPFAIADLTNGLMKRLTRSVR